MSIFHDGYTFAGSSGAFEEGPAEMPMQRITAPGAYGASLLIGPIQDRPLRIRYWIDGLGSAAAVYALTRTYERLKGRLNGTVTKDGPAAAQYDNCTFLGFVADGPPFYSAGGTQGWVQRGYLHWQQRQV
ncbi:hypothetical protein SH661x_003886 [Planctomicrobium sp. SH661]|uniref:hypothetical protein n=1 Tax=Planctomicrobium sp. SH661 TaxID=3448124 RepID=UPI003F5BF7A6